MGGGAIPYSCVDEGAICRGGGTNLYNCLVVTLYATVYMLVLFTKKKILEEFGGGVGWVKAITSVVMAILNLNCLYNV